MECILPITPRPALRARKGTNSVYTPQKYRKYKKALVNLFLQLDIEKKDYAGIYVVFYIPISKTNKKKYLPGQMHRIKPDSDNLLKAVKDAMEKAKIIHNDSQIAVDYPQKYWCGTKDGYIYLKLYTESEWQKEFGAPVTITEDFENLR